jgi:hypothetical protein
MPKTLTLGPSERPNTLVRISIVMNIVAVIFGGSFSAHATSYQEYDWTMFFFLLLERRHGSRKLQQQLATLIED